MKTKYKVAIYNNRKWSYTVSEEGDVYTMSNRYNGYKTKKIQPRMSWNGYLRMSLNSKGICKQVNISRIVAETFIPNPNNYPSVNHKSGIKTDNSVKNLEWCTHAQNTHHAVDNGLIKSNINSVKVLEIKELIGKMKSKDIAKIYNVSPGLISSIKRRRIWL